MTRERSEEPADGNARIRLACASCDRTDCDGITEAELAACRAEGWTEITCVQTYEESVTTYEHPDDAPAGHNVTAWYTHLGLCPDCWSDADEEE